MDIIFALLLLLAFGSLCFLSVFVKFKLGHADDIFTSFKLNTCSLFILCSIIS
ncbi:hypothetical protein CJD42_3220 [Campylobacter jejuni subsp. jejuni D42a]|nr:hypothetical protein CJD42_3220 [Campylobacter jejuni subsp. jejuni D42a]EAQ94651.1 hypothetical protein CJJ8425_0702 [Campylobacter jejuni subsp. jejuni 84-25]EIB80609.1 hypothetical protein cje77_04825 [Campylobacter jejuni subsp. jejuni 1854]